MKKMLKKSLVVAVSAGLATLSFQTHATVGYFAHGYGIKAKGMGGAGVALPQDSLAAATNPAGMVLMGNRWDVGGEIFIPDRNATTAWGTGFNNPPATSTSYDGNGSGFGETWFLIPEFGYNKMMGNNWSFGVSVFGNGGMNTTWDAPIFSAGTNFATSSNHQTSIDLSQLFVSPTLSVKLDDKNSLGVSVNVVYQRIEINGVGDFGTLSSDAANLSDKGYDGSYGVGFKVGWIGQLTDTVSAGFSYQPKTNMKPFEKYKGLFAESGDFDIPANYAFGVSWKATPKMMIAADIQEIKYGGVRSIANPNTFGATGLLGTPAGPGFGWKDMTVYKLGANFQVNKDLVVRAGWAHGNQPIPAGETLFNVLAPAVVEDHLTLGFTMNMNGGELSGFYMHALDNQVAGVPGGSTTGPGANAAGTADIGMSQNAFGIAYGKKF